MLDADNTATASASAPPRKPVARGRPLLLAGLFLIALGLVSFAPQLRAWLGWMPGLPAHLTDAQAPAFVARTLDGQPLHFPGDFSGRLVLLDFWATWCGPCVAEIPHLRAAAKHFADQPLTIISINVDGAALPSDAVANFIKQREMDWTQIVSDTGSIARQYNIVSIPALFLVDADTRRIVAADEQLRGPYLEPTLKQRLAAKQSGG